MITPGGHLIPSNAALMNAYPNAVGLLRFPIAQEPAAAF
jgi:hypothetical protein